MVRGNGDQAAGFSLMPRLCEDTVGPAEEDSRPWGQRRKDAGKE
jgi:hypothetical protein